MKNASLVRAVLKELRPVVISTEIDDASRKRVSKAVQLLEDHLLDIAEQAEKRTPFVIRFWGGLSGSAKAVYVATCFIAAVITIMLVM